MEGIMPDDMKIVLTVLVVGFIAMVVISALGA